MNNQADSDNHRFMAYLRKMNTGATDKKKSKGPGITIGKYH
jgi:hypothetical protein